MKNEGQLDGQASGTPKRFGYPGVTQGATAPVSHPTTPSLLVEGGGAVGSGTDNRGREGATAGFVGPAQAGLSYRGESWTSRRPCKLSNRRAGEITGSNPEATVSHQTRPRWDEGRE